LHFTEAISNDGEEKNRSEEVEQAVQTPSSSDSSTRDTVRAGSGEAGANQDKGTSLLDIDQHHTFMFLSFNVIYIVICVCCMYHVKTYILVKF